VKSEFVRTPKYKVEAGAENRNAWVKKSYHKSAGVMPYVEIALGLYFAAAVAYSIQMENYATVPFLILFVWGYLYTGVMSLAQTHIDRLFAFGGAEDRLTASGPAASSEVRAASSGVPGF
jgi:hypothetical protein